MKKYHKWGKNVYQKWSIKHLKKFEKIWKKYLTNEEDSVIIRKRFGKGRDRKERLRKSQKTLKKVLDKRLKL